MSNINNKNETSNLDEVQIIRLFHDESFISEISGINTSEGIIQAFRKNHVFITNNDLESLHNICEKYIKDQQVEMSEPELLMVSGGVESASSAVKNIKMIINQDGLGNN